MGNYFEGKFHHRNDVPERLPKLFWNPSKVSALQHVSLHDQIGGGWGGVETHPKYHSADHTPKPIIIFHLLQVCHGCKFLHTSSKYFEITRQVFCANFLFKSVQIKYLFGSQRRPPTTEFEIVKIKIQQAFLK